jgi:hypothetical protein
VRKYDGLWRSLAVCVLVAICWWRLLAGVFDAWHFRTANGLGNLGQGTWLIASVFLGLLPFLLIVTPAAATFVNHRYGYCDTALRVGVWMHALASFAVIVISAGAVLDHGDMAWTVQAVGAYPDTIRAGAGEQLVMGLGVLIAADLVARKMQRQVGVPANRSCRQPEGAERRIPSASVQSGVSVRSDLPACYGCQCRRNRKRRTGRWSRNQVSPPGPKVFQ